MGSWLLIILIPLSITRFCSCELLDENETDDDDDDEGDVQEDKDLLVDGDIGMVKIIESDDNNTTPLVDLSGERWVREAVLDVGYYLRAHKFNDFDRRYYTEANERNSLQYRQFPSPPLRYLHWEVYKYCDMGFYECLSYLHDTVLKAELVRSLDTNTIMNQRFWEFPRNAKSIEKVDEECVRLRDLDWRNADPFKGPLERFQWRVSASYFMCLFTMKGYSPLIMFGERCDNFAFCLENNKDSKNHDPRADDSKPFQCAKYSFCPDVCCPLKKIRDLDECLDFNENPCYWQKERERRECIFEREHNQDMVAMALNEWNVTCQCDPGFVWESMFGMCVDVDECANGNHTCDAVTQMCINLKGHYGCVCAWGYINNTGTCEPNDVLTTALARLHTLYHAPPTKKPKPFSFLKWLFNYQFFFPDNEVETSTDLSLTRNESENQITLNPE